MAIRKSGEHISSDRVTQPTLSNTPPANWKTPTGSSLDGATTTFSNDSGPGPFSNASGPGPFSNDSGPGPFSNDSGTLEEEPEITEEDFREPIDDIPYAELLEDNDPRPNKAKKVFISVSEELKNHYDIVLDTRDAVLADPDETGGSKASILNATTSILKDLSRMQLELYNSDTIARIRQAIFFALEEASPEFKDRVLGLLEQKLGEVD